MKTELKIIRERIVAWAEAHEAVRAMILCGSLAREINPGDEWADLDFELFVTDVAPFTKTADWVKQFGDYWLHLQMEDDGRPVFLILYGEAEKVDFHIFPVTILQELATKQQLNSAYTRGYTVLVDKDGLAAQLPPPAQPPHEPLAQERFTVAVNHFWYGALYVAKQIRRGNLWVAKFRDWTLKEVLLQMLEMHAVAINGRTHDTWNDGHFIQQWADSTAVAELHHCFAHFDAADSQQALLATMNLFRRLARETAVKCNLIYPTYLDEKASNFIHNLFSTVKVPGD